MSAIRYRYQTLEFDKLDIHLRCLRDKQEFSDPFGVADKLGISSAQWSLFGVIWDSSEVLAHVMTDFIIEGNRILEVGCGMALSSLVLNSRDADITATDYHPEVGDFLVENVRLNKGANIPYLRTGWADSPNDLGLFDVIIGSDLLYEKEHIKLLSDFINRHAKPQCEVILVDPGRGHHSKFSKQMVVFGFAHTQSKPIHSDYLKTPFKGQILKYLRQ